MQFVRQFEQLKATIQFRVSLCLLGKELSVCENKKPSCR